MVRGAGILMIVVACAPREAEAPAPVQGTPDGAAVVEAAGGAAESVAAGLVHSCVVSGGQVFCWGYNGHGELGDGTRKDRRAPAPVIGVSDAVAVVIGAWHSCALRRGGTVVCWGDGGSGEIGDGERGARLTASAVAGLQGVTRLAAGMQHTCALDQAGEVWCWGRNTFGEVDGRGGTEDQTRPVRVPGIRGASDVAVAGNYACAAVGGRVQCWGQMPLPDPPEGKVSPGTGGVVVVPGVEDAVQLAAGERHACARTDRGRVLCWGEGREGQRGDGVRDEPPPRWHGPHPPPWRRPPQGVVEVVDLQGATALAASSDTTCALAAGAVRCWGAGRDGQLGDGGSEAQARPVTAKIDGVVELSVGSAHVCGRRTDGSVWCWGYNEYGQADNRGAGDAAGAVQAIAGRASEVAIGEGHVCALAEGKVWCVGDNVYGQLGDGSRTARKDPVVIAGIADAVQVVAGSRHSCALRRGGAVQCWGDDTFGQLGRPGVVHGEPFDEHAGPLPLPPIDTRSSAVPVTPVGLGAIARLAVFEHTTCGLQVDGAVVCWHGDGEAAASVRQRLPADTRALALGAVHDCVVQADGQVRCWGLNFYGRIGDGTKIDRPAPTLVRGLSDAIDVAAGRLHTCALRRGGAVACWGTGFAGRLGDGAEEERSSPVTVSKLHDAVALAVGHEYGCALRRGGTVVCWGDNGDGVLGDGTRGSRSEPVAVQGVAGATAIAAGEHSACAVLKDGAVQCWGRDLRAVAAPKAGGGGPGWSVARAPAAVVGLPGTK